MERIIVSIPHTGTRFLKERLGIEKHIHTTITWESLISEVRDKEIISPLRNPCDCWKSTIRRWLQPDVPDNWFRFISAWYMMHALTLVMTVEFIPVDLKKDNKYGITDWTPITGEEDRHNIVAPNVCLQMIYELPFVKQFYTWRKKK